MPRARNIKPGFFDNSHLGKCDNSTRLLFIALWTLADKEGVLEYDVAEIKRYAFGYQNITEEEVHGYITVISRLDHGRLLSIVKYLEIDYLVIHGFLEHQNPHHTEKKGKNPSIKTLIDQGIIIDTGYVTVTSPLSNVKNPADSLFLIPDSKIEKKEKIKKRKKSVLAETEKSFDEFWQSYPTNQIPKGSKAKAKQSYLRLIASGVPPGTITEGSKRYGDYLRQSGAYSKHAVTWLNARGWEDEYVFDNCAGTRVIDGVAYTPTSEYRKKIMAEEAERKAKAEEEAKNEQNRGK